MCGLPNPPPHANPMPILTSKAIPLFFAALCCGGTLHAETAPSDPPAAEAFVPQVWINPGLYSRHFNRDTNFRENNVGFGVEALFTSDHGAMAGSFINSDRGRTHFAAYEWRPLHTTVAGAALSAGVIAGAFDGYPRYHDGGWFPAAMPVFALETRRVGVNFTIVPTLRDRLSGAIAVQVKLRIW